MITGAVLYALSWGFFALAPACRKRMEVMIEHPSLLAVGWGLFSVALCALGAATHVAGIVLMLKALLF